MIQCKDCEFYRPGPGGSAHLLCNPFETVKEPECLTKWQIVKLNRMLEAFEATASYYSRLAPMQEKMFQVIEREIDDISEADRWKLDEDEDEEDWKGL
jgi:hypothetical protein